jgi:hypothetical protein
MEAARFFETLVSYSNMNLHRRQNLKCRNSIGSTARSAEKLWVSVWSLILRRGPGPDTAHARGEDSEERISKIHMLLLSQFLPMTQVFFRTCYNSRANISSCGSEFKPRFSSSWYRRSKLKKHSSYATCRDSVLVIHYVSCIAFCLQIDFNCLSFNWSAQEARLCRHMSMLGGTTGRL